MKPDFLIIGAQKCGTTSLHGLLTGHPHVYMSAEKELHYFDRSKDYPDHEWYERCFTVRGSEHLVAGEATPIYCFWPGAIERIHSFDPTLRLVMLLRHPARRAISQWRMEHDRGDESLSILEAFQAEDERLLLGGEFALRHHSYLTRGRYEEQLEHIFKYFPERRVFLATLENLTADPNRETRRLAAFLSVDPEKMPAFPHLRRGGTTFVSDEVDQFLGEVFAPTLVSLQTRWGITFPEPNPLINRAEVWRQHITRAEKVPIVAR